MQVGRPERFTKWLYPVGLVLNSWTIRGCSSGPSHGQFAVGCAAVTLIAPSAHLAKDKEKTMYIRLMVVFAVCAASCVEEPLLPDHEGDSPAGVEPPARGLGAGNCGVLFSHRFEITGNAWSARLTGGLSGGGLLYNKVASLEGDQGFFENCGRSDVEGAYVTSYWPFDADYTMTLHLTGSGCDDKTVVLHGDCYSDGTGTAVWNNHLATVTKLE